MALEQRGVWEIVRHAVSREVDIPEFQRPFAWEPEQVKLLAESLYRDYPIGSLLLWDSSDYVETKTAQGSDASLGLLTDNSAVAQCAFCLGRNRIGGPTRRIGMTPWSVMTSWSTSCRPTTVA
jgi:hypothetical protein